jgi:hypothetical protein
MTVPPRSRVRVLMVVVDSWVFGNEES